MPAASGLRLRLTGLVIIAGTVIGVAALFGLAVGVGSQLRAAVDDGLRARASDVVAEVEAGDPRAAADDPFAQVINRRARVVSRSASAPAGSVLTAAQLRSAFRGPLTLQTQVPRPRGTARLHAEPAGDVVVVVGTRLEDFDAARGRLLGYLALALVLLLLAVTAGAWIIVGAALRPVARMSRAAETMSGADPLRRLPQPAGHDEIALLGRTLNGLLDRIGDFLEREREFLDDASHELRTPLTVLRGELELAADDPDPERARRGVRIALAEAEHLSGLAEDLLVLARQRGGDLEIQREAVDLGSWIESVLHDAGTAMRCTATVVAPDRVTAWVDTGRMYRVLVNLLSNAAAAGADLVRIGVQLGPRDDEIVIDVSDDGPGFDPAFLPNAFERFARGGSVRQPRSSGAGLGLAIAAALVDAHGGTVTADNASELGGARVRVHLPVHPASHGPGAGPGP